MGASSVMPARRTDIEPKQLGLVALRTSFAPDELTSPHSVIRDRRAEDRVGVALLSATAGYIDAVGVITLMGMFPAHVTGEIVGLTTTLTAGHHTHPSRIAMIPTFVLALFVAALVTRSRKNKGESGTRALFALMAGALTVCTATGFFGKLQGPASFSWAFAVREGSIVAAMAFQTALRRETLASACPTTVMTGNLMQLVFDLVDVLAARFSRERHEDTHARPSNASHLKLMASALGAFTLGALFGGYLTGVVGEFSIVLPLVGTLLAARRFA